MIMRVIMVAVMLTMTVALAAPNGLTWEQMVQRDCPIRYNCQPSRKHEVFVSSKEPGLSYVSRLLLVDTTRLDLSKSNLGHVTRDTFGHIHVPRTRVLKMSHSGIHTIDADAFVNAPIRTALTHLDLSHNNLTGTKGVIGAVKSCPKLKLLDLRHNPGIDCGEVRKVFGKTIRKVLCDDPISHIPTFKTTAESAPKPTSIVPLNPTPTTHNVKSSFHTTTSSSISVSNIITSPIVPLLTDIPTDKNKETELTSHNYDSSSSSYFNSGFIYGISFVLVCFIVIVIVYLVILRPRKVASDRTNYSQLTV